MADRAGRPRRIDVSVPNVARMYDYWLGGKDNFAADRQAADRQADAIPSLPLLSRENRRFLHRAVRFCAERGVTQFLDIGSGLPARNNVHEVAELLAEEARVVYVDNDPVVMSHAGALLATDHTRAIYGDLTNPQEILAAVRADGLLDFSKPIALLIVAVLHYVPDDADPVGCVAALRDALVPGSFLVISHVQVAPGHLDGDVPISEVGHALAEGYKGAPRGNAVRTREEITAFFGDMKLVEPGLTDVWAWRPEINGSQLRSDVMTVLGGVAEKG